MNVGIIDAVNLKKDLLEHSTLMIYSSEIFWFDKSNRGYKIYLIERIDTEDDRNYLVSRANPGKHELKRKGCYRFEDLLDTYTYEEHPEYCRGYVKFYLEDGMTYDKESHTVMLDEQYDPDSKELNLVVNEIPGNAYNMFDDVQINLDKDDWTYVNKLNYQDEEQDQKPDFEEDSDSEDGEKKKDYDFNDTLKERMDTLCDFYAEECDKIVQGCKRTCEDWEEDFKDNYEAAAKREAFWTGVVVGATTGAIAATVVHFIKNRK